MVNRKVTTELRQLPRDSKNTNCARLAHTVALRIRFLILIPFYVLSFSCTDVSPDRAGRFRSETAAETKGIKNAQSLNLALGSDGTKKFLLSATLEIGVTKISRGYWFNHTTKPAATPPTYAQIANAKNVLRHLYHTQEIFLLTHKQYDMATTKKLLTWWRDAPIGNIKDPSIILTLNLQNYQDNRCNYTNAELTDLITFYRNEINDRAIAIWDVYNVHTNPARNFCNQANLIKSLHGGELHRIGLQPDEPLLPPFNRASQDVYSAVSTGVTHSDWTSKCNGKGLLTAWVDQRVNSSLVNWFLPVVAFDYDKNAPCGVDEGSIINNEYVPLGRLKLAHDVIITRFPGGGGHSNFGGFFTDFQILQAVSIGRDGRGNTFYDAIKAGRTYSGYYAPALNELAHLFSIYDAKRPRDPSKLSAEQIAVLKDPRIFHPKFYLNVNPELRAAGYNEQNALHHWLRYGIWEKRRSSPSFWIAHYFAVNPDIASVLKSNPAQGAVHFFKYGAEEGRWGSPELNAAQYVSLYPDLNGSASDGAWHYSVHGYWEGRLAGADLNAVTKPWIFNPRYYLEVNPDLAASGFTIGNAILHWAITGAKEGRTASPAFAVSYYHNAHADIAASFKGNFVQAIRHYNDYGRNERRWTTPSFVAAEYSEAYSDVAKASNGDFRLAAQHYAMHGYYEQRPTGMLLRALRHRSVFNAEYYKQVNGDLPEGDYLLHWLIFGSAEGRSASAAFDPRAYLQLNGDLVASLGAGNFRHAAYHFVHHGAREGRSSTTVFNALEYLQAYKDVAQAYQNDALGAAQHYAEHGYKEARPVGHRLQVLLHPLIFNAEFYLKTHFSNNSALKPGDAQLDWLIHGYLQKKASSPIFSLEYVLAGAADDSSKDPVIAAQDFISTGIYLGKSGNGTFSIQEFMRRQPQLAAPLDYDPVRVAKHFISAVDQYPEGAPPIAASHGLSEDQVRILAHPLVFSSKYYLIANPDLAQGGLSEKDALTHWLTVGHYEGRRASPALDPMFYIAENQGLYTQFKSDFSKAIEHFFNIGLKAGLRAARGFKASQYLSRWNGEVDFGGNTYQAATHFSNVGYWRGLSGIPAQ